MNKMTDNISQTTMFCNKVLNYSIIEDAIVLPHKRDWQEDGKTHGGIVEKNGSYYEESAFCPPAGRNYEINTEDVVNEDSVAIYLGFLCNIWGHCFTDNIKRLWFFQTGICQELLSRGAKCIYITIDNQPLSKRALDIINIVIGENIPKFRITNLKKFKKIYVPDCSLIVDGDTSFCDTPRLYTSEFVDTIQIIKEHFNNCQFRQINKVYFSRSRFYRNKTEIGEKRIEAIFMRLGYEIIHPEELSLTEQIGILISCDYFASTEGSISHNVIFCKPNTNVIIIRKADCINTYQFLLNEIARVNVTFINSHHSTEAKPFPHYGPFFLYPSLQLWNFSGRIFFYRPYFFFLDWYVYRNRNRKIVKKLYSFLNWLRGKTQDM